MMHVTHCVEVDFFKHSLCHENSAIECCVDHMQKPSTSMLQADPGLRKDALGEQC